ncbi:hypothetical protein PU629_08440 [Pullulanibacillus sp. KACC 23026]|nr:hypothetical protein [Pullulanibacillus sp. KACC 23026]WEG14376.1 hypothetical protein PU629_08440 [Pullulanibacillus sp. KACC 23026]
MDRKQKSPYVKENNAKGNRTNEENQPGYGDKKVEGPNRPST